MNFPVLRISNTGCEKLKSITTQIYRDRLCGTVFFVGRRCGLTEVIFVSQVFEENAL
jgi:hypothetical protein